jgi:hypothetical protein
MGVKRPVHELTTHLHLVLKFKINRSYTSAKKPRRIVDCSLVFLKSSLAFCFFWEYAVFIVCISSPKDCKIYLVGTKLDLLLDNLKQRAVDLDLVTRYSDGIQAQFIEVSNKTGENIGKCWRSLNPSIFSDIVLTVNIT